MNFARVSFFLAPERSVAMRSVETKLSVQHAILSFESNFIWSLWLGCQLGLFSNRAVNFSLHRSTGSSDIIGSHRVPLSASISITFSRSTRLVIYGALALLRRESREHLISAVYALRRLKETSAELAWLILHQFPQSDYVSYVGSLGTLCHWLWSITSRLVELANGQGNAKWLNRLIRPSSDAWFGCIAAVGV